MMALINLEELVGRVCGLAAGCLVCNPDKVVKQKKVLNEHAFVTLYCISNVSSLRRSS